jgi:hypothetical protein
VSNADVELRPFGITLEQWYAAGDQLEASGKDEFTLEDLARAFGVPAATILAMVDAGILPPPIAQA